MLKHLNIAPLFIALAAFASTVVFAADSRSLETPTAQTLSEVPAWLRAHVGTGDSQIAPVVLNRARGLYQRKLREGSVKNPCYFAMDATRPSTVGNELGRRFYVICEAKKTFMAVSSGHGGGRNLAGILNLRNGRRCATHFSNALDSRLTTGGAYVTAEPKTSFKGYFRAADGNDEPYLRTFLQFDGEGDTANARPREIGGHPAVYLSVACRKKDADSPHADEDGYVPFGRLVSYAGGRSSGCTSWTAADSKTILALAENNPTTLYIYPESGDIAAVVDAIKAKQDLADANLYWNTVCLKKIGKPKFWKKDKLEPIIEKYNLANPIQLPPPKPVCKD